MSWQRRQDDPVRRLVCLKLVEAMGKSRLKQAYIIVIARYCKDYIPELAEDLMKELGVMIR